MSKTGLHLRAGMRVGLLGGSFDPAHAGHVHITRAALRLFGLDRVVWLVSPGNPLKREGPVPFDKRMERAHRVMNDPRVIISDAERRLGTRYTAETLRALRGAHPGVRFVWLMGADNLAQFDRWQDWRGILQLAPVGVLARPGWRQAALGSKAARIFRAARVDAHDAGLLPLMGAPAWCFVNLPMMQVSSTEIRARGGWKAPAR